MLQEIPGFRFLMALEEAPRPLVGPSTAARPSNGSGVCHLDGQVQNLSILTPSGASKRQLHRLIHLALEICVGLKPESKLSTVELGRSARVHIMSQVRKHSAAKHSAATPTAATRTASRHRISTASKQVTMVHLDSVHIRPHHSEEIIEVFGTCTMAHSRSTASIKNSSEAGSCASAASQARSVHAFTATLSPRPQNLSGWALLSFRVF